MRTHTGAKCCRGESGSGQRVELETDNKITETEGLRAGSRAPHHHKLNHRASSDPPGFSYMIQTHFFLLFFKV